MRKIIRSILRSSAEEYGVKPSKYVHKQFENRQVKKYGLKRREINKAKGTHPKRTWKNRINVRV